MLYFQTVNKFYLPKLSLLINEVDEEGCGETALLFFYPILIFIYLILILTMNITLIKSLKLRIKFTILNQYLNKFNREIVLISDRRVLFLKSIISL